tara:strand:- start:153 stop:626 length:474 start_codon:yes stop_codon:yes gene_type:complete
MNKVEIEVNEETAKRRGPRKQDRRERVPLGTLRLKMAVSPVEGYVLRWLNDRGNRIGDAEQGGYQFVTYEELGEKAIGQYNATPDSMDMGERVSKVVGTQENGVPLVAFLMKIDKEWYDDDQKEKANGIRATELGLMNLDGASDDLRNNSYGEVKIG